MVKAAKKAIYAVVGGRDVTDEELITVFAGMESPLNSRPLTYQSSDPRDDLPLIPNHFLHDQMGGQFAPESVETTTFHPCQRWRKVEEIISRVHVEEMAQRMCLCRQQPTKVDFRNPRPKRRSSFDSARYSKTTLAIRANC